MDSGAKESKKKLNKQSKEFVPKHKPENNTDKTNQQLEGQPQLASDVQQETSNLMAYPSEKQLDDTFYYYYNKGYTKEESQRLAHEHYGMNPDGSLLFLENAGVVDPEAQITEESKHPAEEYNTFNKEYRGWYSNRYYDGGSYDDYGFYYLPDGSFYDPNGYYFDQNGKDEYGGYYNEHGEYVEPQQDKPQKPKEQSKPKQSEESKEPEELKVPEEQKELHDSHEFDDGEDEEEEKYTKDYIEYAREFRLRI